MDTQDVKANDSGLLEETTPSLTVLEIDKNNESNEKKQKEENGVKINAKDYSWLRKNNYENVRKKFKTTYILQHKKYPDKIVELRAASASHACNMIHWKPNQVRLLGTKTDSEDIKDRVDKVVSNTSLM